MPEWKRNIVKYLNEHENVSPSELAGALNIAPNTAKKTFIQAWKKGFRIFSFGVFFLEY